MLGVAPPIKDHNLLDNLATGDVHTQYAKEAWQTPQSLAVELYHVPGVVIAALSNSNLSANLIYYEPFVITSRTATVQAGLVRNVSLPTNPTKMHAGIYSANSALQPTGTLLHSFPEITFSANPSVVISTVSWVLPAGLYVIAYTVNAAIQMAATRGGIFTTQVNNTFTSMIRTLRTSSVLYAPLPSTPVPWDTNSDFSTVGYECVWQLRF